MSTKNLSRTAIEGGRTGSNKWDRRYSHAETRADEKAYLGEVKADLENFYDYDIPKTRHVGKDFNDKLGPMYRWLESKIGLPWDEVRSQVTKDFDTRTTAGRHIVYDHLLRQVEVTPNHDYGAYYRGPEDYTTSFHYHDYYVDDNGLLQKKTYIKRKQKTVHFNTHQIANWLTGRVVGKIGKKLFWFVPADKTKKRGGTNLQWMTQWGGISNYYSRTYGLRFLYLYQEPVHRTDKNGQTVLVDGKVVVESYKSVWKAGRPNFRQDRKLNDKELAFWNTIPEQYQIRVLEHSPTYPNPPKQDPYGYYGY